jgi:hypothetical protein
LGQLGVEAAGAAPDWADTLVEPVVSTVRAAGACGAAATGEASLAGRGSTIATTGGMT